MDEWLATASVYELVKDRTHFLRGLQAVAYSTKKERQSWALKAQQITAELTRRNKLKP